MRPSIIRAIVAAWQTGGQKNAEASDADLQECRSCLATQSNMRIQEYETEE